MNMKTVLATLATVATDLDQEGLVAEANVLDVVMERLATVEAPVTPTTASKKAQPKR